MEESHMSTSPLSLIPHYPNFATYHSYEYFGAL